jgi:hypothetical protein
VGAREVDSCRLWPDDPAKTVDGEGGPELGHTSPRLRLRNCLYSCSHTAVSRAMFVADGPAASSPSRIGSASLKSLVDSPADRAPAGPPPPSASDACTAARSRS